MSYDLITLGETMLALSPPAGQSLQTAPMLVVDHAGAESNTSVGLARLGRRVAWVSRLGDDPAGDRILQALQSEGVETSWVKRDPQRPTGLLFKDPAGGRVRYYRDGSAASRLAPEDLTGVPMASALAVLVTGVTALLGPQSASAALALLAEAQGLRAVDPNLRVGLWGSPRRVELVLPLIGSCDLVLGGEDELSELLGSASPEALARGCASRGPREVVVRSREQLGVLDRDGHWMERADPRSAAVDPVGAGDAFNAGYLAMRLQGAPIPVALAAGVRCGAAVAQQLGDTAGFPRSLDPV